MGNSTDGLERRKALLKAGLLSLGVRGLGAVALLLLTMAVTRTLTPSDAGLFFLANSIVYIVASASLLGLDIANLRFIGIAAGNSDWEGAHGVAAISRRIAFFSTSALAMLLAISSPVLASSVFGKPELTQVLQLSAPGAGLLAFAVLVGAQLQAVHSTTSSIVAMSILPPLAAASAVLALEVRNPEDVALIFTLSAGAGVMFGAWRWQRVTPKAIPRAFSSALLRRTCAPLWATTILAMLGQWSTPLLLGVMSSAEDVAFYLSAYRVAVVVSFVLIAVNFVLAPRLAQLAESGDTRNMRELTARATTYMVLASLPATAAFLLAPHSVMGAFGPSFEAAAPLLVVLSIGQFVNVATGPVGFLLNMSGHEKDLRNIMLVTTPITIVLSVGCIAAYGAVGGALAAAVGLAFQNVGATLLVYRRLGFSPLTSCLSSLVMLFHRTTP